MPRLRGHHLVCLHFFKGEGYSAEFVANLRRVLEMAESEPIEICVGADDICRRCPYLEDNRCQHHESAEEEHVEMDDTALRLLQVTPGVKVPWEELRKRLPEVFPEWSRSYCEDCDWKMACDQDDFFQSLRSERR